MNPQQQIPIVDVTSVPVTKKSPSSKIYVRAVWGWIEKIRRSTGLFFLAAFLLLPWVTYQGQQAILLDFAAQRFHLFGLTLWPQDLTLFAWLFIVAAFALFFVTVIWGRVWCGFMCPQTVFTFLFVWVEEKVEGSRNKRIKLDKQQTSVHKVFTKLSKHLLWWAIAFITATTFVGYFTPIRALVTDLGSWELAFWPAFYIALFAFCTYANAGWMRELMCTHICPYSRFQSSMFDNDTITVTYDAKRGEGRGPRSRKLGKSEYQQQGLGDCIDCNLCVQVCPAGIDIRDGLQYECINCGACVDACNDVMSKMHYDQDLISFTSQSGLEGKAPKLLRPKVIGYFVVLLVMTMTLVVEIATRPSLDMDVIRDRNSLYRETLEGDIKNVYTLVIRNKAQHAQTFNIQVDGLDVVEVDGIESVEVQGGTLRRQPISIIARAESLNAAITPFTLTVKSGTGEEVSEQVTFFKSDF